MSEETRPAFSGPIWEGIYGSFSEIPDQVGEWNVAAWIERSRSRLEEAKAAGCRYQEYLLPVVCAMVAAHGRDRLTVLDLGGGMGPIYPAVRAALPARVGLDFHVVDNAATCAGGREAFAGDAGISFHTDRPELAAIDVLHLGSVIQYVEDWRGFLADAQAAGPDWFLISDAWAGEVETFITAQTFYGKRVPCRFLNIGELIAAVEGNGHRLVMRTEYDRTMLGRRDPLPMEALPERCRFPYAHHLLFRKA